MRAGVVTRVVGTGAVLIDVDDPAAWFVELSRRRARGELDAVDIVPAAATVLIDGVPDPASLAARIRTWPVPTARPAVAVGIVEVPVEYGGPDLASVAQWWAVDEDDAVARIAGIEYQVAFCGFAPGFAYLTGLDCDIPRLPSPRTRVPAGSVALAGPYAGIYPHDSPGGWRIVGHTGATLFNVDRDPPALLVPSMTVRLVPV